MNRIEFRKHFKVSGPAILPVIHVLDSEQTIRNVRVAITQGAAGVFLINHDFDKHLLLPVITDIRRQFPSLWLGVNFLAVTGRGAFPILGDLQQQGIFVDAYWADDARIDERTEDQPEATEIHSTRLTSGWSGMYFGGTAFKKQREVSPSDFHISAQRAVKHMDVVTTSGVATGAAADLDKIKIFRDACGDNALGIASGVTAENIEHYAPLVDAILIATGINHNDDFYNIDPQRLQLVLQKSRAID